MTNPRARSRSRFGYPDMNPATLLFLTQELRRARRKHPTNVKNFELIEWYMERLVYELASYTGGEGNAATVFTTGLTIAVMAIRLVEEGTAGNPYRGNAPSIGGPLGEYEPEKTISGYGASKYPERISSELDTLTTKVIKK